MIYSKIIKEKGMGAAGKYYAANAEAVEKYKKICGNGGIDCDFEISDSYVFSKDAEKIAEEYKTLEAVGADTEINYDLPDFIKAAGGKAAVGIKNQAMFHVRKFIGGVSEGLNIRENTFVRKIDKNTAFTDNGKIQFRRAVIATHFPIINHLGLYFVKMYQFRTYLAATECDLRLPGMFVDEADGGMTFRRHGNLLVYGGGGHKTGKQDCRAFRSFAARNLPGCAENTAGRRRIVCRTTVPYIGRYSPFSDNLYVITGFQ